MFVLRGDKTLEVEVVTSHCQYRKDVVRINNSQIRKPKERLFFHRILDQQTSDTPNSGDQERKVEYVVQEQTHKLKTLLTNDLYGHPRLVV